MHEDDQHHIGDAARGLIDFFASGLFKAIAAVLCLAGILIGFLTGFDFSGRVPRPGSFVLPIPAKPTHDAEIGSMRPSEDGAAPRTPADFDRTRS